MWVPSKLRENKNMASTGMSAVTECSQQLGREEVPKQPCLPVLREIILAGQSLSAWESQNVSTAGQTT